MKFRIPRKLKKKLGGLLFMHPSDSNGGSTMANPTENQEDYNAYKNGILEQPFRRTKKELKESSIAWKLKYHTPIEISDDELLEAVNNIFAEQYRKESYSILKASKNHNIAINDYYTFVNSWELMKKGEDSSITACLSVDSAKLSLMKRENK